MIPNLKHRALATGGVTESGTFGISTKDSAHIMQILRDTLYSDKILAVLREYSSNAWDAHREAGKADLPIRVTLPTQMAPTLSIRDWGPGLSPSEVFEVYTQYGASTKRDSDETVGTMGIGSKAGFAYSDSFTVISCHGGQRRTYVAVLDSTDSGLINLLHEEPCDLETGVEIQIAVREGDINEFEGTAKKLFKYFVPRPEINVDLPPTSEQENVLTDGSIYGMGSTGWVAVMGCIPYRINLDQLRTYQGGLHNCVYRLFGALRFNIGEVHISASREELKYSDLTKQALKQKFDALIDEYVQQSVRHLESLQCTPWEKRWKYAELTQLNLPLPKKYVEQSESIVPDPTPVSFTFTPGYKILPLRRLHFTKDSRIVLRDDSHRWLKGYDLNSNDFVVRRAKTHTWAQVTTELTKFLSDHQLTGIPTEKLSTMSWRPPPGGHNTSSGMDPTKYKFKVFRLIPNELLQTRRGRRAPSRSWEAFPHQPEATDVFVVLRGFRPEWDGFADHYRTDQELAESCGEIMPVVYGYRSTKNHEMNAEDLPGTEYTAWRVAFREQLRALPKVQEYITLLQWARMFEQYHYWSWKRDVKSLLGRAARTLGSKHYVVQFLTTGYRMRMFYQRKPNRKLIRAAEILTRSEAPNSAEDVLKAIREKYPLLTTNPQFFGTLLSTDHQQLWLDYIKAIDASPQESP